MAQVRLWISLTRPCVGALILPCFAGRWINAETGLRSDVPHNMIYPLKQSRPNLHVLTGVHVKHVTFDGYVFQFALRPLIYGRVSNTGIAKTAQRALPSRRTRYSTEMVQQECVRSAGLSS